jgi:hypothetical protein
MRAWLYFGLGVLLGMIPGTLVATLILWTIWPDSWPEHAALRWIVLPFILVGGGWGYAGFPIGRFKLPGGNRPA